MRIPRSTYRLQFNPEFGFAACRQILPYLKKSGITDLYASPLFESRRGSLHGYDITDSNKVNPQLGTEEELIELLKDVRAQGMGWTQDIVPNHMAYDPSNTMLMDVLEKGAHSEFFRFFDVDWRHPDHGLRGRLLAPFLGRFYAECLEDREIRLNYDQAGLSINYYDWRFPVRPESYLTVFTYDISRLEKKLGKDDSELMKFLGYVYSLKIPENPTADHHEQLAFAREMIYRTYNENPTVREFIDENIRMFNCESESSTGCEVLDSLLEEQKYRLSFWKVATEEINYRRFFNINELICLRQEDPEVFASTHRMIDRLVKQGVTGLRVDHIDGLFDPKQYLNRLRELAPETWLLVEKILMPKEELPSDWPVSGSTGYDFLGYVNGIFVRRRNQRKFNRIYSKFTGNRKEFLEIVAEKKRLIIGKHMAGNIDNLARFMREIAGRYLYGRDLTLYGLKRALVEVLAMFPVYRTYVSKADFREADREYIRQAVSRARQSSPGLFYELTFIEKFLLLEDSRMNEEDKKRLLEFVMRFQQISGPLMAKGFEDTLFYVYNRFISLNEVGSSPDRFGIYLNDFHNFNRRRLRRWPNALNALTTHDTKRGEDARARLNVLSEMPEEWDYQLKQWHRMNRRHKTQLDSVLAPDKNDEYYFYQTLIGSMPFNRDEFPAFKERLKPNLIKAVREAKVYTAWLKPDNDYEQAYLDFCERSLDSAGSNAFLESLFSFQEKVEFYAVFNSLSQTLIKITAPGVPDFYQGSELWNLSMVDPDNRRTVDFALREKYLAEIETKEDDPVAAGQEFLSAPNDGKVKLFLIRQALNARNSNVELFQTGAYKALEVKGKFRENIVAFVRFTKTSAALIVVPRFISYLVQPGTFPLGRDIWQDTELVLPESECLFHNILTGKSLSAGREIAVGEILSDFPAALLIGGRS